jgi:hypothetical protein
LNGGVGDLLFEEDWREEALDSTHFIGEADNKTQWELIVIHNNAMPVVALMWSRILAQGMSFVAVVAWF